MQRCLQLAKMGIGNVAPNPMVGSVIVFEDKIIGEGYHQKYGEAHAEVNAINSVKDKSLLEKSTIYVNLEPCSHFGKTPPCANLIVEKKIPRVVIGCLDSNVDVAGKGIEKLKSAGIEVEINILEKECRELNIRFFTFHEKKRPYVILKWAQSADGFIDVKRTNQQKGIVWMSQPETKKLVHQWRHEEAGILVGWKTIATDNPELTCREVIGKNPIRIVIDQDLRLDYTAFKVGNRSTPTIVLTKKEAVAGAGLEFINPSNFSIAEILNSLHQQKIQSVIIEGGKTTIENFITSGIWDEARIIQGITTISEGELAPKISGTTISENKFGKDLIRIVKNG